MSGARISSTDIIRAFRAQLATFHKLVSAALSGRANELVHLREWLRHEQLPQWKKQANKREEAYQTARRQWLSAEAEVTRGLHSRAPHKPSSVEERVAMNRALKLKEEADVKVASILSWLLRLDREGEPLISQCKNCDLELKERGDKALRELDRLAENVQSYLDVPVATPTQTLPGAP